MDELPQDVAHLVDHWSAVAPDADAIRYGTRSWTWTEFAQRVDRNAAGQLALGLRPGDRVAYLDKNHPACLETSLACLRIGTANAVVNFRLAPDEVRYVIDDARARVVFVGAEFLPLLDRIRADLPSVERVVVVGGEDDEYEAWLAAAQPLGPTAPRDPNECFLQMYTSGTTGFPKGAMLTNASTSAHSAAVADVSPIGLHSSALVAMPLFHVGGTGWALVAMFHGAPTVIVRDIDPVALLADLQRTTHAFLVPAVFGFLVRVPGAAERDYSRTQALFYGASPMPLPLLRASMRTFAGVDFYQVYGMTEASGTVTVLGADEHRDPAGEHLLTSAGRPLPGVALKIVDPVTGDALPTGEVGEVWVRTKQIMAGYWHKPDADAAALTDDGWLRSGDAGHLDDAGYVYLSDRIKDMIISGGENIYPAEIERVLAEYPDIAEVTVIGVPDDTWGEVGKAVVVPRQGVELDEAAVLAFCREHLASFKCPKSMTVVAELPRNATGKVLKRQLRESFWVDRESKI